MGSVLTDTKLGLGDDKESEKKDKGKEIPTRESGKDTPRSEHTVSNPSLRGDLDLDDLDEVLPDNEIGGLVKGMTTRYRVDEFKYDVHDDILNFVEGAIPRKLGLAILQDACVLAGFKPGTQLFMFAKGAILSWLVINTASGNHDFTKVIYVRGSEKHPFPTKTFQDAMRRRNVDELRRVGVALLPEQKKLVDGNSSVREYIAQLNGIKDLSRAWLGIDSIWKLPGVSTRDAALAKKYAKARISRAKVDGKTSSAVADDMFAIDEGASVSVLE